MKTRSKITSILFILSLLAGMLLGCEATQPQAPAAKRTPTTAPTSLTAQEATDIALAHAGLTADQVTVLHASYELDDGTPEYEVEFRHSDTGYDYTIHAETGKVLSWDTDHEPTSTTPSSLTVQEAEDIALTHAGLSRDQVTQLRTDSDLDDDDPTLEVEFHHDGWEYDYEIHRHTGEVVSWDKERS